MILTTEGVIVEWMWWAYIPIFLAFAVGSFYFLQADHRIKRPYLLF